MNVKVIFSDGTEFSPADYPIAIEPSIFEKQCNIKNEYRETIRLTLSSNYASVAAKFVDNAKFLLRQFDVDNEGNILKTYIDFDKSEFCIAGDIVDHRDGRITIYMGKKTEHELEVEELSSTVDDLLIEMLGV